MRRSPTFPPIVSNFAGQLLIKSVEAVRFKIRAAPSPPRERERASIGSRLPRSFFQGRD